jgi:hypothetical protein
MAWGELMQLERRSARSRPHAEARRGRGSRGLPEPPARVSAVIPTLNEAANLPHVFARLPVHYLHEVIIVDGHSTDDTIEVARALHPPVRVVLQEGLGKGNALACGFVPLSARWGPLARSAVRPRCGRKRVFVRRPRLDQLSSLPHGMMAAPFRA